MFAVALGVILLAGLAAVFFEIWTFHGSASKNREFLKCLASLDTSIESYQHCANVTGHTPREFWVDGVRIQIRPEDV